MNVVIHPIESNFPWQGTELAIRLMRFFSIALACGTIFYTYRLGLLLTQNDTISLAAAFFVAFNPMFIYVSASVNNDNLSTLIGTLLLYYVTRQLLATQPPRIRDYMILGAFAGIGMLAKFQLGFFLPIIALCLALLSWRYRNMSIVIIGGLLSGGLTILIAGWWYFRNWQLYGDPTGVDAFLDVVGRQPASDVPTLISNEYESFLRTFWGMFGWVNVPMTSWIYLVFYGIAIMALIGLLIDIRPQSFRIWHSQQFVRWLAVIWVLVVLIALIRWSMLTTASQGRLLYAAIAPIGIGISSGLFSFIQLLRLPKLTISLPILWFGIIALVVAPITIVHAYDLPPSVDVVEADDNFYFVDPSINQQVLSGNLHDIDASAVVGDYVEVVVDFQIHDTTVTNWSIFVHLVNEFGVIEAQRDVIPGGGRLGLASLPDNYGWRNYIAVHVPQGIYAPQKLNVVMGFYDVITGRRLILDSSEETSIVLGSVDLLPTKDKYPNPVDINFDDTFLLNGYDISSQVATLGKSIDVTLHWQITDDIANEYVVSVQLINPSTFQKAGQLDRLPSEEQSNFNNGQSLTDIRSISIDENTPSGPYRLLVSIYRVTDDGIENLPIHHFRHSRPEYAVYLGWVNVVQ